MRDPFTADLFGGSPKMVISASATSIDATTAVANRSERATSSLGPAIKSSCAPSTAMPHSLGATRDTEKTGKSVSNAACFGTKGSTSRRSLSDRLTPSLISSGLVCGITPSLTRKQSSQPIQVLALDTLAGGAVAERNAGYSSLSACSERGAS